MKTVGRWHLPREWLAHHVRWCRIAIRLACLAPVLIALAGCAATSRRTANSSRGASELAPHETIESTSSSLSPDGTVVALYVWGGDSERFLFYDVRRGAMVAATTDGWTPKGLVWGPGHSYLQLLYPPSGLPGLYWAREPGDEPKLLTRGDAELNHWGEFAVDPAAKTVVFTFFHESAEGDRAAAAAVPVSGGRPRGLLAGSEDMHLAGVVADPNQPGGALAVLARMAPEGERLGLRALSCETREDRWQTVTPRRAGKWMLAESFGPYGEHRVILAEQLLPVTERKLDLSSPTPQHTADTRLWLLDTRNGALAPVAEVPDAVVHLLTMPSAKGKPGFLAMGRSDVWRVEQTATGYQATRIIEGRSAHPIGAAVNPEHGVGVYFTARHALWRCRLEGGAVERVWGKASADQTEVPPRVLGKR